LIPNGGVCHDKDTDKQQHHQKKKKHHGKSHFLLFCLSVEFECEL
jgi:hypothetical protein